MIKRKLVYVLHDIKVGGAEVALMSSIPQLVACFDLRIVVLGTINENLINHLSQKEKDVFKCFDYPIATYPFSVWKVVNYIRAFSPDVMICSFWRASIVGIIIKYLSPTVKFYSFNHSTRFPHFFSSLFTKWAGRKADCILTDGEATTTFVKSVIKPTCPIKEVSFLTNSTPSQIAIQPPKSTELLRFMFLGRINKVKNLPLLIEVIHQLTLKGYKIVLDIYGRNDGDLSDSMKLITEYGLENNVLFKGEVKASERFALFSQYHFYIQLSSFEGMAMSVAEAMQNGLVCIVSPVGEIVNYSKDMQSAIHFIINDPSVWETNIAKIESVINDPILYTSLSNECHVTFLQKKNYSNSLIATLES